jgi:rhodanese-related sulfurtransferase
MRYALVVILAVFAFFAGFVFQNQSTCSAFSAKTGTVNPQEYSRRLSTCGAVVLDVRTAEEFRSGHLKDALNADFYQTENFSRYLDSLDKTKTYFVYCRTGKRSAAAMNLMVQKGFSSVINLAGGITAWQSANLLIVK